MTNSTIPRRVRPLPMAALVVVLALVALMAPASASAAADLRTYVEIPDTVVPGQAASLTVAVRNEGDTAASGTISIALTASGGLDLQDAGPDQREESSVIGVWDAPPCARTGATLSCDMPAYIGPGAQFFYTFNTSVVDADAVGPIAVTFEVDGAGIGEPLVTTKSVPVGPPPAFGFAEVGVEFLSDGEAERRAASNPDSFTTRLRFNYSSRLFAGVLAKNMSPEHPRDVTATIPLGLLANPQIAPRCTAQQLAAGKDLPLCPADTQVGLFHAWVGGRSHIAPLYNLDPPVGTPAAFGFNLYGVPVQLVARIRDGDYGVEVVSRDVSSTLGVTNADVTLWGTPADASHDFVRGLCLGSGGTLGAVDNDRRCPSGLSSKAFLRLPTSCSGEPLGFAAEMRSYEQPSVWKDIAFQAPPVEGCDVVPFDPALSLVPSSGRAGAPTGLDVVLSVPQHSNPNGLAQADLRRAEVVLPEGMTINPSSGGGLQACTDTQLRKGLAGAPLCPPGSKIGSVSVVTPLLDHALEGSVYVLSQRSGDPASGEMFRIAVTVDSPDDGIHLKLPGAVAADPATGRLTTTFDNNPQLPFSEFRLRFKSGPRAPLVNPPTCGTQPVEVELEGWNGAVRTPAASFEVDEGCGARGFDPGFEAGSVNPVAGGFSPFVARFTRPDGDRELRRVDMRMPQGVLADLSDVELCSNGQIAAATGRSGRVAQTSAVCSTRSLIGSTTVGAGAGSAPFYPFLPGSRSSGRVFLTEPYTPVGYNGTGAPAYGLAFEVPAVAGPYDLGDVIVRAGLFVDPETAEVTIVSDPLPLVVKGVRLFVQDVRVNVDREDFTLNPTSCAEKQVRADIGDPSGVMVRRSSRFQVGDCSALAFKPRLGMRLVGKRQMRSGGHPVLRARLVQGGGQANIEAAKVTLPPNVVLDSKNSVDPRLLCGYDAALKADCPASSIIGKASLRTPLLKRPLSGPVHFVQGIRFTETGTRIRTLPTLLVKLRGEVAINLRSRTNVDRRDRLVSTFPKVPDARAAKFNIQINGGRKGILVVTENRRGRIDLCNQKQTALVKTDAHNGKRADYPIRVKTSCAKKRKR